MGGGAGEGVLRAGGPIAAPQILLPALNPAPGDERRALTLRDRVVGARAGDRIHLAVDPSFDPLHGAPRSEGMLRRMDRSPER